MMIYMMMVMLMVMLLTLVHPCNSSRSSNSKYASRDTKKQQQQQQHSSSVSSPPNIVVLLADNLAYEDVGIFRQQQQPQRRSRRTPTPTRTPNLDQIASEGRRLYNWNSPAVLCSASRAALLTGKYPIRTGIYPRVFEPDAIHGLLPHETTLAKYLQQRHQYATKIVGKWHLGQRPEYLPTNHGFDEWYGIPYHMSGGSIDDHVCGKDTNRTMWLPLYDSTTIIEQPVRIEQLAERYVSESIQFMTTHANKTAAVETTTAHTNTTTPFFLYLAFSHVHQLCAPRHAECQWSSSHFSKNTSTTVATFDGAVEEMDWIAGEIVQALRDLQIENNTIVLFTSDNGPWVGEQECSGKKGRFEGRWLAEHVPHNCTACPSEYIHAPILPDQPRRCIYPRRTGNDHDHTNRTTTTTTTSYYEVDGIHCGQDTGLGSAWEANVRMPAFIKWPNGGIPSNTSTMEMVSTLDVVPTLLSLIQQSYNNNYSNKYNNDTYNTHNLPPNLDGIDVSDIFLGRNDIKNDNDNNSNSDDDATRSSSKTKTTTDDQDRVLFFWRDGFRDGPLPQPFGRFDVVAMKIGAIKVWFYTKSSHYNPDPEVYHDPPLLFDILDDPAEAYPLDPILYSSYIDKARILLQDHKNSIDWTYPLCLERDPKYLPCANETSNCRTASTGTVSSKSSSGRSSNYIAYNGMHNDPPLSKSDESAVA